MNKYEQERAALSDGQRAMLENLKPLKKPTMECDICGHRWIGDEGPMDQCPACGLLFVGPIGQKDEKASDE